MMIFVFCFIYVVDDGVQFVCVVECECVFVVFVFDGWFVQVFVGDIVFIVILVVQCCVCVSEFSGQLCVGFCLIGVCQDCWVCIEVGVCVCVCLMLIVDGMWIFMVVWLVVIGDVL